MRRTVLGVLLVVVACAQTVLVGLKAGAATPPASTDAAGCVVAFSPGDPPPADGNLAGPETVTCTGYDMADVSDMQGDLVSPDGTGYFEWEVIADFIVTGDAPLALGGSGLFTFDPTLPIAGICATYSIAASHCDDNGQYTILTYGHSGNFSPGCAGTDPDCTAGSENPGEVGAVVYATLSEAGSYDGSCYPGDACGVFSTDAYGPVDPVTTTTTTTDPTTTTTTEATTTTTTTTTAPTGGGGGSGSGGSGLTSTSADAGSFVTTTEVPFLLAVLGAAGIAALCLGWAGRHLREVL